MTRVEALAAYFESRPDVWIDGRELAHVAGSYAWRTRISDLRRAPFYMQIENRQRRIDAEDGSQYIVSEYMFSPEISEDTSSTTIEVTTTKEMTAAITGRLF